MWRGGACWPTAGEVISLPPLSLHALLFPSPPFHARRPARRCLRNSSSSSSRIRVGSGITEALGVESEAGVRRG